MKPITDPIPNPWGDTLEDALRNAIKRGEEDVILALVKLLPAELKNKYRAIWLEAMNEKGRSDTIPL